MTFLPDIWPIQLFRIIIICEFSLFKMWPLQSLSLRRSRCMFVSSTISHLQPTYAAMRVCVYLHTKWLPYYDHKWIQTQKKRSERVSVYVGTFFSFLHLFHSKCATKHFTSLSKLTVLQATHSMVDYIDLFCHFLFYNITSICVFVGKQIVIVFKCSSMARMKEKCNKHFGWTQTQPTESI